MTDEAFPTAIANVLKFEGGYVNDPVDPGGETNFGISKRSYPTVDVKALTEGEAIAIYKRDFWDKLQCGRLDGRIGSKLMDIAINMGPRTGVILLQRAINHCDATPPVAIDGMIGNLTIKAANSVQQDRLLTAMRREAANHYIAIASAHPVMRKYLRGWLRRANA